MVCLKEEILHIRKFSWKNFAYFGSYEKIRKILKLGMACKSA